METITRKFNFKTRAIKDETGKEIGRTKKQPSLEVALPVPSAAEVQAILAEDSAISKLVLSAVQDLVYSAARDQFDEIIEAGTDDLVVSADMLNYDKLTLEFIASIPPSQRGAAAISEEEWKTFYADYLQVMVAATGKPQENIKNHVGIFEKPQRVKAQKAILELLVDQLNIYVTSTSNLDENAACVERLIAKFTKWKDEPAKEVDLSLL